MPSGIDNMPSTAGIELDGDQVEARQQHSNLKFTDFTLFCCKKFTASHIMSNVG